MTHLRELFKYLGWVYIVLLSSYLCVHVVHRIVHRLDIDAKYRFDIRFNSLVLHHNGCNGHGNENLCCIVVSCWFC